MKTVFVILGAAIGAPSRFVIDQYIRKFTTQPYGIFLVNILGSFVWGISMNTSPTMHALFVVGFAGAFTTWSTVMLDFFLAYDLKRYREAAINLSASIIFGLCAAWLGLQLAQ